MEQIATNTTKIDVEHLGDKQVIASCLLEGEGGAALVDTGPASTLPTLKVKLARRGLQVKDICAILLTHIHLDHAGASGSLVKENPRIRVYVHERGAPHMLQPGKLLESAKRLYKDDMDRLWGEFLPLPAENVQVLKGGERVRVAGRTLEIEYTPGHASHHVTYFDPSTGIAFTGDTAGIRISNRPCFLPPTPPPDIDLELWSKSLDLILSRKPEKVFLTHFGPAFPAVEHIARMREELIRWGEMVRQSLQNGESDDVCAKQFAQAVFEDLKKAVPEEEAIRYMKGASPELCWYGLARYWKKRAAA